MRQTTKPLAEQRRSTEEKGGRDINAAPPAGQSPSPPCRRPEARARARARHPGIPGPSQQAAPSPQREADQRHRVETSPAAAMDGATAPAAQRAAGDG